MQKPIKRLSVIVLLNHAKGSYCLKVLLLQSLTITIIITFLSLFACRSVFTAHVQYMYEHVEIVFNKAFNLPLLCMLPLKKKRFKHPHTFVYRYYRLNILFSYILIFPENSFLTQPNKHRYTYRGISRKIQQ